MVCFTLCLFSMFYNELGIETDYLSQNNCKSTKIFLKISSINGALKPVYTERWRLRLTLIPMMDENAFYIKLYRKTLGVNRALTLLTQPSYGIWSAFPDVQSPGFLVPPASLQVVVDEGAGGADPGDLILREDTPRAVIGRAV